jgi:hypothetical protein
MAINTDLAHSVVSQSSQKSAASKPDNTNGRTCGLETAELSARLAVTMGKTEAETIAKALDAQDGAIDKLISLSSGNVTKNMLNNALKMSAPDKYLQQVRQILRCNYYCEDLDKPDKKNPKPVDMLWYLCECK